MSPGELARGLRRRTDAFRKVPLARITNALDRLHAEWSNDPPVARAVSRATGYPEEVVSLSLRHLCGSMRRPILEEWLARSGIRPEWLDGVEDEARTRVYGPRLTLVVSSGNVPGAALPSVVQALLLKSPVVVKSSSAEPVLLPAYAAALAEMDAEVAAALAVASWRGGDEQVEPEVFSQIDAAIVYGSDATLRSLRSRLPAHARFIGYGHRISFTVIARECLTHAGLDALAAGLVRDVCLFDQQGCLSPQAVYVEEGGAVGASQLAERVAALLEEPSFPRRVLDPGENAAIHQYRAACEMEALTRTGLRVLASEAGTAWTVVLDPKPDLEPGPGNRTLVVRPVADLAVLPKIVERLGPSLISCGLAAPEERRPQLTAALGAAGVTRFTTAGDAQLPQDLLFHDGVSPLASLARFVRMEQEGGCAPSVG